MDFVTADKIKEHYDTAVFASGCFWGTEYWFAEADGVIATQVGYAGGQVAHPSYKQVCTGQTGHAESVLVIFDPQTTNYENLVKLFFETHDPSQVDRQGPDIGSQYRSVIFYRDEQQKNIAEKYRDILIADGISVATRIEPLTEFYPEKDMAHQKYYEKKQGTPYCHFYQKKFE